MHKVTAKHLLEVYKTRLEMQEQGITNPLDYKNFHQTISRKAVSTSARRTH